MQEVRIVHFVARHTVELQGLRTALVGGFCLIMATWTIVSAGWATSSMVSHGMAWVGLALVGWHLDDRLVAYYRARMGYVNASRPGLRLLGLLAIALAYWALRALETWAGSPVSISALLLAGVQLHIGLISGRAHRRHYLVGASCWALLALFMVPVVPPEARDVSWLVAIGLSLTVLGWLDHVLLMRLLPNSGRGGDVEDV